MGKTSIAIALVGAAACGGTSTAPIAINDFVNEFAAAVCDFQVNCGAAPDQATCLASLSTESMSLLTEISEAQAGKIKYDGAAAARCVNEIKTRGCAFVGFQQTELCTSAKIFPGTVAMGGTCIIDADCAGGAACGFTPACNQGTTCCMGGTCGAPQPAPGIAGATCIGDAECALNLYCSMPNGASSGSCKAAVTQAGAACDTSAAACANPMYCDILAASPTCKTPAARGATCVPTDGLPCVDSRDFCDKTTTKCTATLAAGMTCDPTIRNGGCVADAICDATTNKCVALGGAGATCTTATTTKQCLNSLQCTNNACTLPPPGMACQ